MSILTEKSQSRFASRSKAQYSSKKDSRRENEEANAERGVLAETRRRRALENGNEVISLAFSSISDSAFLKKKKGYSKYVTPIQSSPDLFRVLLIFTFQEDPRGRKEMH